MASKPDFRGAQEASAPPKRARSETSRYEESAALRRTLKIVVGAAAQLAFPDRVLIGGQTVGEAYMYGFDQGEASQDDVDAIAAGIRSLISSDARLVRVTRTFAEATKYFEAAGMRHSLALLRSRVQDQVQLLALQGSCLGDNEVLRLPLVPTGELALPSSLPPVRLSRHRHGFVVIYATDPSYVVSPTLLASTTDHKRWATNMGVNSAGELNSLNPVGSRELTDFILQAEFRQESILAQLSTEVHVRCQAGGSRHVGVICIAGPTSSGKTTFATKLAMYLRNKGMVGMPLTVDHYYLPLDQQPRYQARKLRSDVDYDAIESMDAKLVNEHINALLAGEEIMTPVYNMKTGYRDEPGHPFKLPEGGVLIIEGIHALNPDFLRSVPAGRVFKVYISPLSTLQLDESTAIKTTDHRLLRRMSRDYLFRGHSASRTLSMWPNVRRGEHTWIFPHMDAVDFVVNSAMEYEMGVLKNLVEPLLMAVAPDDPQYEKAQSLLALLGLFNPIPPTTNGVIRVPAISVLREFIGEGAFDCH